MNKVSIRFYSDHEVRAVWDKGSHSYYYEQL